MSDSIEMDWYSFWKKEFDKGEAGIFKVPVSEIVELMEDQIVSGNYTEWNASNTKQTSLHPYEKSIWIPYSFKRK